MIIRVRNKHILEIDDFQFRCCIGKNGLTNNKIEGDKCTPKGKFRLSRIFYRADRILKFKSKIEKIKIKKNMGWCDDPNSKSYNKLINLPFNFKCEKLFKKENTYDIILVLNYNMNPIRKNKGSAIFIHIAKKNYKKTKGCIATGKKQLLEILKKII